ncbi:Methyltransferase domain-containing protein [Natronorubrum sediminis]|uniref:Methyltransferase domain-containing protein n=1 Tax=Natronorubrum sediminis TaxID=640943 RepID=A0A1H6G3I1_9EURY|nr:class I SAM-dependent methyltransferase [Natronorubrum sediminis]SEH17160.1 Methyltransferase domain-containing protein [Natronorubrum sediminis]
MSDDEQPRTRSTAEPDHLRSGDGRFSIRRSILEDESPGRALDVATGTGRNALALAAAGWTVDALDISRAQLDRARTNVAERSMSGTVHWILADVDSYCFRPRTYDLITIRFFDARDRLPAVLEALAPGGVLWYEHYLTAPDVESGPGAQYRFDSNELLAACSSLSVVYYAEYRADGQPRVTLIARNETDAPRRRPSARAGQIR